MIRLHQVSTLFPYTTLFRSVRDRLFEEPALQSVDDALDDVHHDDGEEERDGEDRKSTRLNSSHQINSYAVSCLKKKRTCQLRGLSSHYHYLIPDIGFDEYGY